MMIILKFSGYILLLNLLLFTKNQQEVYTFTIYINFYVYYSVSSKKSSNIRVIKSRQMSQMRHIEYIQYIGQAHRILAGKCKEKIPLGHHKGSEM